MMKRIPPTVLIAMTLFSPLLQAASKDVRAAQAAPNSQTEKPAGFDKNLSKLQQLMTQMQGQQDQIRKTWAQRERQKLMQQHWDMMQSAMN
jgi:hypothetical protein